MFHEIEEAEMKRILTNDDVSLTFDLIETGAQCSTSWSTLLLILVILRLFVSSLWAIGRGRASTDVSGRGERSSLLIDR